MRPKKCIVCKSEGRLTRGLCVKDYERFRRALKRCQPERRKHFERFLVTKGLILKSRQGKREADGNVFAEYLSRLLDERNSSR